MKRRNFIKTAGSAATLPIFLNGVQFSALARSPLFNLIEETDRVLVLIQMNGGNDGLNTVVPLDQYSGLSAVRGNIMVPENQVLRVTDTVGFHPGLKSLKLLYEEGRAGIVQNVGYPNQNRSHFRSYDIWSSGSAADEFVNTGWMGRYFQNLYPDYPEGYPNAAHPHPFAVTMGYIVSETCQGTVSNYSVTLNDPFNIYSLFEGEPSDVPETPYGDELEFLRTSIAQANAYSETITTAANAGRNAVEYSTDNRLARQLKNVALLISGGLQTNIYVVNIGGFDTHANQVAEGNTITGKHAELLEMLSSAISTFQEDLRKQSLEHRVIGMTFSEFGRKIKSNESFGTDHGTAAPMILFGTCINSSILGDNPDIPTDVDPSEGVPMQHDFRDVYGSVLMDWFKVEESAVKTMLYPDFKKLPIIEECQTSTSADEPFDETVNMRAFPNPFRDWTRIEFNLESDSWVRLSIFNALGSEIKVLTNQRLRTGEHSLSFDASQLPAGAYFYRLQIENQAKTKRMIKL